MRETALKRNKREIRNIVPFRPVKNIEVKTNPFYKELRYENLNEESRLAIQEARDIAAGKIESKGYNSVDELMKDLLSDVDD